MFIGQYILPFVLLRLREITCCIHVYVLKNVESSKPSLHIPTLLTLLNCNYYKVQEEKEQKYKCR